MPVNGIISPLPPLLAITSRETQEVSDDWSESEGGSGGT